MILVLGIFLRLYNLGGSSLWFDEAASVMVSLDNRGNFLSFLRQHHPLALFESLLYYWSFAGNSEFVLRLPAAICGMVSILFVFLLGRVMFDKGIALIGAFLLAISPFHIYYSQEVRTYSFNVLLSILSTFFLVKLFRRPNNHLWAAYLVCSLVNIILHFMTIYLLAGQVLFCLFYFKEYKIRMRNFILIHLVLLCLVFVWWIHVRDGLDIGLLDWWVSRPSLKSLFLTFKNFSCGYTTQPGSYIFVTLTFILLFLCGVVSKRNVPEGRLLFFCLLLPIGTVFLTSQIKSYYLDRYFIFLTPYFYILVAAGLFSLRNIFVRMMLLVSLVCAIFLILTEYDGRHSLFLNGVPPKIAHRQAASYLMDNYREGDIILHTCFNTTMPFSYYFFRRGIVLDENLKNLVARLSVENNTLRMFEFTDMRVMQCRHPGMEGIENNGFVDKEKEVYLHEFNRVWLIFSDWYLYSTGKEDLELSNIRLWLDDHFQRVSCESFPGIEIYQYEKRTR
jgi:uncharacterized membrane protein